MSQAHGDFQTKEAFAKDFLDDFYDIQHSNTLSGENITLTTAAFFTSQDETLSYITHIDEIISAVHIEHGFLLHAIQDELTHLRTTEVIWTNHASRADNHRIQPVLNCVENFQ